jgi:hypothetical protein
MAFLLDIIASQKTLENPDPATKGDTKARDEFLKALECLRRGQTKQALTHAETKGVPDYFKLIPGLMTYQDFIKSCKDNPECSNCYDKKLKYSSGRVQCPKCSGNGVIKSLTDGKIETCPDCKKKGFKICSKCRGKPHTVKVSPLQLQLILQLELLHETKPKAKLDPTAGAKSDKWSAILVGTQVPPLPVLSLRYLTEFDPRQSVYKDGKWVQPQLGNK